MSVPTRTSSHLFQDNSSMSSSNNTAIPVTLKWSKKTFDCTLDRNGSALDFKETIQKLTGVPIQRQKLMAKGKGYWKGPLSDDYDFSLMSSSLPSSLTVTLIGSAEILTGPPTAGTITFVEDLTPLQIQAAENAALQEAMKTARGMIPALQLEPHKRHVDDKKTAMYQYNHMVKGLPQAQIEDLLLEQQQQQQQEDGNETTISSTTSKTVLLGKVVMTMGLELRRAYINDMTVLHDGTLVSALDDGHIQLWKHGTQQYDIIHPSQGGGGRENGGVDSVVAWEENNHDVAASAPHPPLVAFASAGRGSIHLWNDEGQVMLAFSASPIPHATTPRGLVRLPLRGRREDVMVLAAYFRSTYAGDPHQFRLPPQNETERQRRAQAQAQEQALQRAIQRATQSVQIWYSFSSSSSSGDGMTNSSNTAAIRSPSLMTLKSLVLNDGTFTVSCLESIPNTSSSASSSSSAEIESHVCLLVSGDVSGGLRVWRVELLDPPQQPQQQQNNINSNELVVHKQAYVRLSCPSSSGINACSVVCMKSLYNGMLAVSTTNANNGRMTPVNDGARILTVARAQAVHIISDLGNSGNGDSSYSVVATINGHQDAVQCLCELPNGDLLTGGGKMDATIKMWSRKQLYGKGESSSPGSSNTEETRDDVLMDPVKTLPSSDAGYVFALQVLLDQKPGSTHFAVAAARYNVVKILL